MTKKEMLTGINGNVEVKKKEGFQVGIGDAGAIDNYLILMVKVKNFADQPEKLVAVMREVDEYQPIIDELSGEHPELKILMEQLLEIHGKLWYIEDRKRAIERGEDEEIMITRLMGEGEEADLIEYLQLSRQVSKFNDIRASLKRQMNQITGSKIVEVKSHKTVS